MICIAYLLFSLERQAMRQAGSQRQLKLVLLHSPPCCPV